MPTTPPIALPLDLTGRSPDNKVVGEPHTLAVSGNRAIVLNYGPFFTTGLVIRKASDGTILTPQLHYKAAQLFPELTVKTGQEVCSLIVIDDPSVGSDFLVDAQMVGGDYSVSVQAIQNLIDTLNLDERPVRWGSVIGKPEYFPPTPHLHDLGDLYGFEYLVAAIEGVRQAILLGDSFKDQEIYDWINSQDDLLRALINGLQADLTSHVNNVNNPHHTTKTHVGLSNVENYPIATQSEALSGASNVMYMTPLRTKQAMDQHVNRTDNPHSTTKTHVGLGNVDNFATATLSQALEGVAQDKFLTPFGAQAMIDQAIAGQGGGPIYVPPTAKFTSSGATNVPYNSSFDITFTNQSTDGSSPITTYAWDFGDGTTSSVRNPPVHHYTNAGVYTVVLTVSDGTTNPTRSFSVQLTLTQGAPPVVPPTVDFNYTGSATTTDPNNPLLDFDPSVTAGSAAIASYLWEFDVNNVASQAGASPRTSTATNPAPHQYAMAIGTVIITVRLTVTDVNGVSGSSVKTITLKKNAANVAPTANFTYTGATTVTSPAVHSIDFNSTSVAGSAAITTYAWDFGDGTTSNVANPPAHAYTVPVGAKSFIVKLTVTDANGLTDTKQITLNLTKNAAAQTPPTANFTRGGALTVNEGTNHSISVSDTSVAGSAAITSWSWDWGDGTAKSTGKTPAAHTYITPVGNTVRTITLTVTDANGNTDTYTVTFTLVKNALVSPTAAFTKSGALTVTEPTNHSLTFADASTQGTGAINKWEWKFGDGKTYVGQNPPAHVYSVPVGTTSITVTLKVTDVYGRTNTATQTFNLIKNKFVLPALANLNFESGDTKWDKSNGVVTINQSTGAAYDGTWRANIGYNGGATNRVIAQGGKPITAGQKARVACRVRPYGAADGVGGQIRIVWLDYWGAGIANVEGPTISVLTSAGIYGISAMEATAPTGAYYFTLQGEAFVNHAGGGVNFDQFDSAYAGTINDPTGPGGGPTCVAVEMYLLEGLQAEQAKPGMEIDGVVYNPDGIAKMPVRFNKAALVNCFHLKTVSGIELIASDTTPFNLQDGSSKWMPDMLGELVLVDDDGDIRWEAVASLEPAGMRWVAHIDINDHCFFAGMVANRRVASHNALKDNPNSPGSQQN